MKTKIKSEMMKLLSMTDFVLDENFKTHSRFFPDAVINYAQFLKQPLKLEMFVPCDEGGEVLEQPCEIMQIKGCRDCACREYLKAKEKVLFEIEKYEIGILNGGKAIWINNFAGQIIDDFKFLTIEDLVSKSFQLTPTAIKQIQKR